MYGSPNPSLKNKLWSELRQHCLHIEGPWLSVGDYNAVIAEEEVSGTGPLANHRSASFTEWIFDQGFLDMGYSGPNFTWTRGLTSLTFKGARLDRALCNVAWRELFPKASVFHLPKNHSDHAPLLVRVNRSRDKARDKRFQFQATWIPHPEFQGVIRNMWNNKVAFVENVINMTQVLKE